ncbi:hypothetical protein EON66_01420 [archaeon]|nr:MAG: hypothetical protein EON66_01420 [archaeon]
MCLPRGFTPAIFSSSVDPSSFSSCCTWHCRCTAAVSLLGDVRALRACSLPHSVSLLQRLLLTRAPFDWASQRQAHRDTHRTAAQ